MAAITPTNDLYLLKVPIEIDNANQLTFANTTAQYNYFSSCDKIGETDFTYQRKDGVIRYPAHIDSIINYNYVMYRNDNYSNKWFYAFIDGMRYVNDGMTEISIKTDVWQTWCFDLEFKQSFIEREHVNDDTIGLHTVPEGLETGEYEIVDLRNIPIEDSNKWGICVVATQLPNAQGRAYPRSVGGVLNSMAIFCIPFDDPTYSTPLQERLDIALQAYDSAGEGVSIENMYMIPDSIMDFANGYFIGQSPYQVKVYPPYDSIGFPDTSQGQTSYTLEQPAKLSGDYTPVNKKLFTYPYSYFYVTNKVGADAVYRWEDFDNETTTDNRLAPVLHYKKLIVPTAGLSAKMYFTKYKKYSEQYNQGQTIDSTRLLNYGLNFAKVPVCAWTTDYYTNWLTQNGVNIAANIITGGVSGAISGAQSGGAYGAAIGAATNTLGSVVESLVSMHNASIVPNQSGGDVNSGDVLYAYTLCGMGLYMMSIRPEMAQIIDKFFSVYGYKVNTTKVPNITGRTNWNYVKTVGCNIHAYAPQEDINEIKEMFNNGVTFWHNPATFLDYSQNNTIIQ